MENVTSCDRRISRAARAILQQHLSKLVAKTASTNGDKDANVWELLYQTLPDSQINSSPDNCVLIPAKDMYKEDEEHVREMPAQINVRAYPSSTLKARKKMSSKNPNLWYQCGYCSKIFMTRYYLDLHMDNQHRHEINSNNDEESVDGLVCPAQSWCRILGGDGSCNQMALQLEPYYDRGSGGWGADSSFIQHKLAKEAHAIPCTKETIAESKRACHEMLETCGWTQHDDGDDASMSGSAASVLSGSAVHYQICGSLQCPNRILHHVLGGLHVESWLEHWHIQWSRETEHHQIGFFGFLLLAGLLLWYGSSIWNHIFGTTWINNAGPHQRRRRSQGDVSGRRLFQKSKQRSSSSWMPSSWKTSASNARRSQKLD